MLTISTRKFTAIASLVALCGIHVAAAWYLHRNVEESIAEVGRTFPLKDFRTLDGGLAVTDSLQGRKQAILFIMPTCVHCRVELMHMEKLREQFSDRVFFWGISLGTAEATTALRVELHLSFPVLLDARQHGKGSIGMNVVPAMFLVDEQQVLRYHHTGEYSLPEEELMLNKFVSGTLPE